MTATSHCSFEDTFAKYAPGIQINVPAIHHNALPQNIAPSSSPGYITPAFSGVPNTGTKNGGNGGQIGGEIGENFAWRARRPNALSKTIGLEDHAAGKGEINGSTTGHTSHRHTSTTILHSHECAGWGGMKSHIPCTIRHTFISSTAPRACATAARAVKTPGACCPIVKTAAPRWRPLGSRGSERGCPAPHVTTPPSAAAPQIATRRNRTERNTTAAVSRYNRLKLMFDLHLWDHKNSDQKRNERTAACGGQCLDKTVRGGGGG